MVIDSHVHFWKYDRAEYDWIGKDMKILREDYLPSGIENTLRRNGVDGCIAVNTLHAEVETRFLAELAETHPFIKGVIGWTDLQATDVRKRLSDLKAYAPVKGFSHKALLEPDDFFYSASFRNGLAALAPLGATFDLLIHPGQLKAAADLAAAFPGQQFILDHLGSPAVRNKQTDTWQKDLEILAAQPNVACKLSGLFTEARWKEWSAADFYPYLDIAFQAFGTKRLMYGSDWPILLLSGIYVQWKSLLEKYMENFLPEEKEQVFGLNAASVYGI